MPTLEFKGKSVIQTYHHTVPHCRLEFDPKLSLLPKGEKPSLDGNLIIEGDNLLALKALLPTHAGKVKCIYIDPPYNTGEEGWVYNDNLTQPQFKEWIGQTTECECNEHRVNRQTLSDSIKDYVKDRLLKVIEFTEVLVAVNRK